MSGAPDPLCSWIYGVQNARLCLSLSPLRLLIVALARNSDAATRTVGPRSE